MIEKQFPDFEMGLGDSGRATADMAVSAIQNESHIRSLLEICFEKPYPSSMRASRVLQLYFYYNPEKIKPYLIEIIEKIYYRTNVSGVKRNFLKVLAEKVEFSLIADNSLLLQIAFEWLVSPKLPVAIRYYSIILCEKFCKVEPDLIPEFVACLEMSMHDASVGFKNRAKKALKKYQYNGPQNS